MGDVAAIVVQLLKWTIRLTIVFSMVVAFIIIINIASSYLLVGVAQNALTDVLILINIWLPFDLNVVLTWVWTAATAYFVYNFAVAVLKFTNNVMGSD